MERVDCAAELVLVQRFSAFLVFVILKHFENDLFVMTHTLTKIHGTKSLNEAANAKESERLNEQKMRPAQMICTSHTT